MPTLVVDIRRNALDDGPGIRSTVFFKGCVLDCVWCQNPETLSAEPELQYNPQSCVACGDCAAVCPTECITFGDANAPGGLAGRLLAARRWKVLAPEAGTGPNVYYLV